MRTWSLALIAVLAVGIPVSTTRDVVIHVDDDAASGGNGTAQLPYRNLPEAVAAARIVPGTAVIRVRPGNYALAEPLVIDSPLELRGSTRQIDSGDGWPSGQTVQGTEARILATNPGGSNALLVVGRTDASVLENVHISGFVFEGTPGGIEVLLNRVQRYLVQDNVFRTPAFLGLQSVASSGRVVGNHFSGVGTGAIFAGGYAASPSMVVFSGNRSVGNNLGGVLLNGASINIPELGDALDATVRDNDLSNNAASAQGFGLRVFILRRDPGAPGDSQSASRIHAVVRSNRLAGNRIGISIDAGFPYRQVGSTCDPRVFSGEIDLQLAGNTLTESVVTPALVTFTRNAAALIPAQLPQWQYLHNATFSISDKDGTLAGAWIDHPQSDPFVGPCPNDATAETLGNVLRYNGAILPNGRNF